MQSRPERTELIARLATMSHGEEQTARFHAAQAMRDMRDGATKTYVMHQQFAAGALACVAWLGKIATQVATAPTEESALAQFESGSNAHALAVVRLTAHGTFLTALGELTLATANAAWRMCDAGEELTADRMATAFSMLTARDRLEHGEPAPPLGIATGFGEPVATPSTLPSARVPR